MVATQRGVRAIHSMIIFASVFVLNSEGGETNSSGITSCQAGYIRLVLFVIWGRNIQPWVVCFVVEI